MPHVTIGDLKRDGKLLEIGCHGCSRHLYIDPTELAVDDGQSVPLLTNRLRCTVCGAKNDAIRYLVWCRPDARVTDVSGRLRG